MSLILTKPLSSSSSTSSCPVITGEVEGLRPMTGFVVVDPSVTEVVDEIPVSDYRGGKWLVTVVHSVGGKQESFEAFAIHQDGTSPSHVDYSHINTGGTIDYIVDTVVSGGNLQLTIENNETTQLLVYVTRFPIPRIGSPDTTLPTGFDFINVVPITGVAEAETTTILDQVSAERRRSTKWFVTIRLPADEKTASFEVFANNTQNTNYAIVGIDPSIDAAIEVVGIGKDIGLRITNNETEALTFYATRMAVEITEAVFDASLPEKNCELSSCECQECSLFLVFGTGLTVSAGTTLTIDTVNIIGFQQVKWLVTASDDSSDQTRGFQINAHPFNLAQTTYSDIGSLLDVSAGLSISGTDVSLEITNSELFDIVVDFMRVPVST